jgi:predicted MFS family arabinose efflux permease
LILSGLYLANGPAFKSYIYLKSSPGRRAHTMTVVYGAYPLGLVVAPLAGGWLAAHAGMRVVFLLAVLFFVASSLTISGIRDVPYSAAGEVWRVRDMRADGVFARYLAFFAVAFTASYVALPLLAPYLHLAHGQSYTSLGIYLAIASAGAALLTPLAGRISDRRGPDAGWAVVLLAMAAGSLLLLAGGSRSMWALGAFFAGGLDAVRFVAAGLVAGGFQRVPLAWGYALFDAMMGLPMAGGALLGGLLFRAGFGLPFLVAASVAAGLILAIVLGRSPLGAVVRPSTVSGASEA